MIGCAKWASLKPTPIITITPVPAKVQTMTPHSAPRCQALPSRTGNAQAKTTGDAMAPMAMKIMSPSHQYAVK